MRRRAFALLLLILCVGAGAARADDAWQRLQVPEAGFSVSLPGTPKMSQPASHIGEQSRSYLLEIGQTAYLVSYTLYPPEQVKTLDAKPILDAIREAAVKDVGGTLRNERSFSQGGVQGREFVIDGGDGLVYRARLYIRKNGVYRTIVNGPPGFDTSADANRFLDSFQLMAQ